MAKVATIQDQFPGSSFAGTWTASGAAVTCSNGLNISLPSGSTAYSYLKSATTYDCTASNSVVYLTSAGNQALASLEVFPVKWFLGGGTDANSNVCFHINQNSLSASIDNGTSISYNGAVTYSTTLHKYFMLQESGGTTYWYTSADGQHFKLLYSVSNPITLTACTLFMQAGTYASEATSTNADWAETGFGGPVRPAVERLQAVGRAAFY